MLTTWLAAPFWPIVCTNAMTDRTNPMTMDPMASEAASLRCRCFARAITPAATMGSAGISHRFWTIQLIRCALAFHGVHLVEVGVFGVAIDGEDDAEADCGFCCGDADREDREHDASQRGRVRAVAPEGDEVEVGGVEHQFNADEHKDGVAAGKRT